MVISIFVFQICGDYLLSKMDSQNAISYRNFASSMGDARLLAKVDCYIQEHLLEISEQEDFLKLPRLKVSSSGSTFFWKVFMHPTPWTYDETLGMCAVGGDARGSSELAQQWEAVLEGDQLGAAQLVGERGAARETDGGG